MVPWEEPSVAFGGHYNIMWPKNVFWSKPNNGRRPWRWRRQHRPARSRKTIRPTARSTTRATPTTVQQLLDAEGGYWYHAHPRTKSTAGFPDATWDTKYLKSDRYLGVAFKPGMGQDNSEATMCEWRCFDAVDTMNNLNADTGIGPKFVIADIDTYRKSPEDDIYANFPVNYLKLDTMPGPDDDWSPVLKAMRDGNFFVTTGEILIKNYVVAGTGDQRTITADVEWTYPMAFMEIVTGDGKKIEQAGDLGDRHAGVRHEEALDSVRRDGQEVGALRDVGRRRQRRVRAARVARADDDHAHRTVERVWVRGPARLAQAPALIEVAIARRP